MTNKDGISVENINPESVRALVERLRESCGTDAIMASAEAADLIEARERAYLALSERIGVLEAALRETNRHLNGFPEALRISGYYDDTADAIQELLDVIRAALSHKGMDHG